MELEVRARAPRRDRLRMAVSGMLCVDAVNGALRGTADPGSKVRWWSEVLEDPAHRARCGAGSDRLELRDEPRSGSAWRARWSTGPGGVRLAVILGRRWVSDLELAVSAGQAARMAGCPDGARQASGPVVDRAAVMLMVSALAVHDPGRAEEFARLCGAVGLSMAVPAEGWPW